MGYDVGKEGNVAEEKRTEEISEMKQEPSVSPEDMRYMKEAIRQAKKAAALGDVPIGCVIVYQDKIIGRGYNRRMADKTVLAHAEILAMKKACKKRVVIGCMNPKAGCAGSVLDMLHEEGFNHQVQTDINVCREECSGMLSQFFKDLRKKRAEK